MITSKKKKKTANKIDSGPYIIQRGCWMQLSLIKSLIDAYDVHEVKSLEKIRKRKYIRWIVMIKSSVDR